MEWPPKVPCPQRVNSPKVAPRAPWAFLGPLGAPGPWVPLGPVKWALAPPLRHLVGSDKIIGANSLGACKWVGGYAPQRNESFQNDANVMTYNPYVEKVSVVVT